MSGMNHFQTNYLLTYQLPGFGIFLVVGIIIIIMKNIYNKFETVQLSRSAVRPTLTVV